MVCWKMSLATYNEIKVNLREKNAEENLKENDRIWLQGIGFVLLSFSLL